MTIIVGKDLDIPEEELKKLEKKFCKKLI